MGWEKEVEELKRRRAFAERMGGEENLSRQRAAGKLNARERIALLCDAGTFTELGALTGKAEYDEAGELTHVIPANAIIGKGRIDGRRSVISADDFTLRGGSSESTISEKWIYAERMALELLQPLVRLVDTAGGSVKLLEQQQSTKIPGYSSWPLFELMGHVPVVGLAMGSCAGLGAVKVAASHFSVIVKGTAQVFAAGPPVVKAGLGVAGDKEALGGFEVHARGSGVVDNEAENDEDAIAQARRFLSYLPGSVYDLPPEVDGRDDPRRRDEELLSIIPRNKRQVYPARKLLELVLDHDSIFEIGRYNGPSAITCLARAGGRPVGVLAGDPRHYGGAMTRTAAEKIEKLVDVCDTFHLPVVHFVDQPGVMPGEEAERAGTMRAVLRTLAAIEQGRTPWLSFMIRRAFGVGGGAHGRKRSINLRYAWPSASWGSIPLEGGIYAAYRKELDASEDAKARMEELEAHYGQFTSPFRTAERFNVTDIIDPRETRPLLCDWVEEAYTVLKHQTGPTRRMMRP